MKKKQKPRVFRFGKYKGMSVGEVIDKDPSYCKWCCDTFDAPPFTEKELRHLNHVWNALHGGPAVLTLRWAENTAHGGRKLKDIRTADLKAIRDSEPEYAEAARMVINNRRWNRTLLRSIRRPAPYFQTDDIPD